MGKVGQWVQGYWNAYWANVENLFFEFRLAQIIMFLASTGMTTAAVYVALKNYETTTMDQVAMVNSIIAWCAGGTAFFLKVAEKFGAQQNDTTTGEPR